MSEETFRLSGDICQYLFDEFCLLDTPRFGDQRYELEDSEPGEPFVIRRVSDGKCFEVELEATVREVPQ